MFERFTRRARAVLVHAQDEARQLGHNFLGTEHLLLGLLVEGEGVGAKALGGLGVTADAVRELVREIVGPGAESDLATPDDDAELLATIGVDFDQVRQAAEEAFGPGALEIAAAKRTGPKVRFAPRAKKALELALREALQLGHSYVGTEHLLLGLTRVDDGVSGVVLRRLGVSSAAVRQAVLDELASLGT